MKLYYLLIMFTCFFCSCGEDKPNKQVQNQSPKSADDSSPTESTDTYPASQQEPVLSDSLPPMETLGEGKLTEKSMTDAFQYAIGLPLPDYVRPLEGDYKVWNEKDFAGRNRSNCGIRYSVTAKKMKNIADMIEKNWHEKYGKNPDIKIARGEFDKDHSGFHVGTITLGIRDMYASYTLMNFQIYLDPVAEKMWLGIYRGTQDNPRSREQEEQDRKDREEDKKRKARDDAEWEAKQNDARKR